MPRFLINYLKRTIRQDDSNEVIDDNEGQNGYHFSLDVIKRLNIKVKISGKDKIPLTGPVIFAVNHPLGGMDALAIIKEIYPIRNDLKFVVNDLLLHLPNLKDLFVGVNKHGSNSKDSLQSLNEMFASDPRYICISFRTCQQKKKWYSCGFRVEKNIYYARKKV